MPDAPLSVAAALREAAPDQLVEVVDGFLRSHLGARHGDVLMADYRIAGLCSVGRPDPDGEDGAPGREAALRCFSGQRMVVEEPDGGGARVHLPLTAWGERLGVLLVDFPEPPPPAILRYGDTLAEEVAVALRAADRDTDRYRCARRRERLTMAAEMQWDLIPGRSVSHAAYLLAGQLEPAYTVGGDSFDWALNGERLILTALNGHGSGLPASLLTALTVNAMRNARRSGGSLVEQAELASDTVFAEHRGGRHVATLLLELDVRTGRVGAVDAGSPRMVRLRGPEAAPVELEQQLPLGMFDESRYAEQEFFLAPGDRLFVVTDGVYGASPGGREPYGDRAMLRAMRATRLQPATEAVGTVMRELRAYHGETDLDDDAVIVCLDWRGS